MKIRIVGFDPSLNNWGCCDGYYDTNSDFIGIGGITLINPVKETSKSVRQNSKDIDRAVQLTSGVIDHINKSQPHAVFIEVPVGSQSARAMASYGICIGVIAACQSFTNIPFFQITPQQVKLATVGSKTATKQEMIAWAFNLYPSINWPITNRNGKKSVTASKAEHLADAIGAVHAGIATDEFKRYIHTLKSFGEHYAS